MATVWGSGTQADPWTRWDGSAYDFWRSTGYNGTYYTRVGAYFNITDAGDPHDWEDYWINSVDPSGTYGLSYSNYGMTGTCTAAGSVRIRLELEDQAEEYADGYYVTLVILPPPSYTVTLTPEPANAGTVSGGGTYTEGSTATISATATAPGYYFAMWDDENTSNPRTITVTKNINLNAWFALYNYTVSLTAGTGGMVSGAGSYYYGTTATISATPDTNYKFVQWSDGDTNASRSFTVTGNVTLSATFALAVAKTNVKVNGSWAQGSVYVKVNGSWVESKKIYVKVNGTWEESN